MEAIIYDKETKKLEKVDINLSDKAKKELEEIMNKVCNRCPLEKECDRINCKIKL